MRGIEEGVAATAAAGMRVETGGQGAGEAGAVGGAGDGGGVRTDALPLFGPRQHPGEVGR